MSCLYHRILNERGKMPAEILSLDLDWFNTVDRGDLKFAIRHFFATLKRECKLPSFIDFVPEHQYLYPWSVKLLDRLSYRKMNVVNVDEHHDFYCLRKIDFDSESAEVGCWNFFAFMAHKKLMGNYTWVTNDSKSAALSRMGLASDIKNARSPAVRKFKQKIKVVDSSKIFDILHARRFDGFMIIRSPEYTTTYRAVYYAVEEALKKELPHIRVRRYKCRENFKNGRVHRRASDLFWKI